MDSVFDRWGEGVIYVGIAFGCVNGGFGAAPSLAPPRSPRRSWSATPEPNQRASASPGNRHGRGRLAPREVRIVILTAGLILAGILGGANGQNALAFTLGLITVLATITVIQRIAHVLRQPYQRSTSEQQRKQRRERHNGHKPGRKIRVAIVGVGNCASSLVQGRYYYENAKDDEFVPG
jgi:hypothetical protein